MIETILEALRQRPDTHMIAIAGIPGSGKSTLAAKLAARIPFSTVIPMDGYHLPRAELTPDDLSRRGAPHTFDSVSLRADLLRLHETRTGNFPAFDHAVKDPAPNAIRVTPDHRLIIVEGLYLLLHTWDLSPLFDFTIFIDCDLDEAMARVAKRHLEAGICATQEAASRRAETNDRLNALSILEDGCRERANLILRSCPTSPPES